MRNRIRTAAVISMIIVISLLSGCLPKRYTSKEEKDQLAHAIAISRVYKEKYAPSIRLKEGEFTVLDEQKEVGLELYLTDWVRGAYTDNGKYILYINTETNEVFTDRKWVQVSTYCEKLAEKQYGFDVNRMCVDIMGYIERPYVKDDDSFGMITLSGVLKATDDIDEKYVGDLLSHDDFYVTYVITINEDVDIEMFRTGDTSPLGKNVRLIVKRYPEDVYNELKNDPVKRGRAQNEGLIEKYDSSVADDGIDDISENHNSTDAFEGTWYAQDEDGAVLVIEAGGMTLEYKDVNDKADFVPEEKDDCITLAVEHNEDDPFRFYEISFYPDDERIDAYTWPVDDGDGGYKRTVFRRSEYEPGDTKMLELLYGDWEIMDDAELIQEPGIKRDRLRFSLPHYHRVKFITADGDAESFDIELDNMFGDSGNTYDRLTLSNRPGSGKYDWDEVRPGQSFQIMIANNLGNDYMMLRELGDERTGFATNGLRYGRSIQGLWMLRRADPADYDDEFEKNMTTPSAAGCEDDIRLKNTSFYAIKWMEFGNSCTLQKVETVPITLGPSASSEDALEYRLPDDAYAYSAVNYEYSGKENMPHGGYFDPALVYVTTDEEGRITDMIRLEYAQDGVYFDREAEQ